MPLAIDIAIVNYHSAEDVAESLTQLGDWPHGTLWVVDNSVDATQAQQLQSILISRPSAELIVSPENLGFGAACNLAFKRSNAPFFLLLNPDARIHSEDILRLVAALKDDDALAAVSPVMTWNEDATFFIPHNITQSPWGVCKAALATHSPPLARQLALRHIDQLQRDLLQENPFDVAFLTGAVLMLKRSAIVSAFGIFDPAYFMFYEDTDLSRRLWRSGRRLAVVPKARATHHYRHRPFKASLMTSARQTYFEHHFPIFFRLTASLKRVDAWTTPAQINDYPFDHHGLVTSAVQFAAATRHRGVIAFSPLPLMVPAIFRDVSSSYQSFSQTEWDLLEPGNYSALLAPEASGAKTTTVSFTKY
jgi:GT2 family glycosyltransferase